MSNWALLRVMILKEARTTFRERAQFRALLILVLIMIVSVGVPMSQLIRQARAHGLNHTATAMAPTPSTREPPPQEQAETGDSTKWLPVLRWFAIGGAAFVGFFFSMGHLLSAVLASFVGEKEARTLEILLASPLSDGKLFLVKCIGVLAPSAALGYLFAAVASVLVVTFCPVDVVRLPMSLLFYALVLVLPVMLLPQLWFVGLGAAISVKAETVKGAGQVLSAVLLLPIFTLAYGVPMLLQLVPALRPPVMELGRVWLGLPFPAQYASVLLLLGIPAAVFLGIGRSLFRRDRLLS